MKFVLSCVLLIVGVVTAGVWYTYFAEYRYYADRAETYTPANHIPWYTGETPEQGVARTRSYVGYNRDRALAAGAASVVSLALSGMLFFRARKSGFGRERVEYERWTVTGESAERWAASALASPLDVRMGKTSNVLLGGLALFFLGLDAVILTGNGVSLQSAVVVGMNVAVLGFLYVVVVRALRRSVRRFDAAGVARGDGRRFAWTDFESVDYYMALTKTRQPFVWRVELRFAGGAEAWLLPTRVVNLGDVLKIVEAIPGLHLKKWR